MHRRTNSATAVYFRVIKGGGGGSGNVTKSRPSSAVLILLAVVTAAGAAAAAASGAFAFVGRRTVCYCSLLCQSSSHPLSLSSRTVPPDSLTL